MNAIASNQANLICPKGHGTPSMQGSNFCDKCGTKLIPGQLGNPVQQGFNQARLQVVGHMPSFNGNFRANGLAQGQQVIPYPVGGQIQPFNGQMNAVKFCATCGGAGARLNERAVMCSECHWLRPLSPNYKLDCAAFQWAQDGAAMSKLRSIGPLQSVAKTISDKIGRKWVETTLNAILLSERQLPEVYHQAIKAARILGMRYMPDVYVSGDRMWDAMTFGSDDNAFIVLGTALITNFKGDDLMYILAREMGHCRAGHALWKTVGTFLTGEHGPRRGLMAGGVFSMVSKAMNPTQWVESALEIPLLAWARQAEITADRAGLLAVGSEEIARRVLLSWALKSSMLYRQINIEAWMEQQEDNDDEMNKLSEMLSSSTPYITRRLKLMRQFANDPQMHYCRGMVVNALPKEAAQNQAVAQPVQQPAATATPQANAQETVKLNCAHCRAAMRIPRKILVEKDVLNLKCPNPECGKINTLRKNKAPAKTDEASELKRQNEMSDEQ